VHSPSGSGDGSPQDAAEQHWAKAEEELCADEAAEKLSYSRQETVPEAEQVRGGGAKPSKRRIPRTVSS
jgi:hypothetical protein